MSDPLYVGVGIGDEVGTATIDTAGQFTITAHGLVDGQPVRLDTLTGGASAAFDEGTTYYVVNAAADTFDLVSIPGDTVITLGSSGGADVHTAVPHYSAPELRRADAVLLYGGAADAFGARQGVRPGHTPVSVSGTTWTVEHLTAAVYPGLSSTDGPYRVQHETESGSLDPADGSNDRIDALDLQIQDEDEDASGFRRARVVYVAGTPASSPSAPAVTSNALRLGTILVSAGGSPSPSIATLAQWTVASGGVLPVRDSTELPSSGTYDGMMAWDQDVEALKVDDGSGSDWSGIASRDLYSQLGLYAPKIKQSNQSRSSSTTFATDNDLFINDLVAGQYILEMFVGWDSATNADWKFQLNFTGSFTGHRFQYNSNTESGNPSIGSFALGVSVALAGNGTGSVLALIVHGSFIVTATGDLQFQWAQNTSQASNTVVRQCSYMRLQKVS